MEPTESITTKAPNKASGAPVNPPPAESVAESVAQALSSHSGTYKIIPAPGGIRLEGVSTWAGKLGGGGKLPK